VQGHRRPTIDGEWPYLWLDATYLQVRDGGRIVSVAAIIAVAVTTEGRREIVGLGIGPSDAEPFLSAFLKCLVKRGLKGVKLVISNAHEGLRHAISRILSAGWQRCRVDAQRSGACTRANTPWSPPKSAKPSCKPTPALRIRPGDMSPIPRKSG
jgi:putative transposase